MLNRLIGSDLAARSKQVFANVDTIARNCSFVLRFSRHFSAGGFLLTLLKAAISGKASFNQLAMTLGVLEERALSRQALHKRIDRSAVSFMLSVVAEAVSQRWDPKGAGDDAADTGDSERGAGLLDSFARVIVGDSSQRPLPAANHEAFPAHGNGHGETSGCKFDLCFDLKTGEPVETALHLATTQDREIGPDLVDTVRTGDLILRDMGYFSVAEFARIGEAGAFWLSRLPANTGITDGRGRTLEKRLRSSRGRTVEFEACVGADGHRARLVAVRATEEVAGQRRHKRSEAAKKQGRTAPADTLLRDGWHIMVTNIPNDMLDAGKLFTLYGQRWQIEIVFRAWKQSGRADAALSRRSNEFHLQCLMYASLLHLVLTMKVSGLVAACVQALEASIEKLADSLASHIMTMLCLDDISQWSPDPRHLALDRRKNRRNLAQTRASGLS